MPLKSAAGFCRRFGVGLRAGVDLIPFLKAEARQGSSQQRDAINALVDGATEGEQISKTMQAHGKFFPPLLVSMTRVGEATGRMESTMLSLAEHYDNQISLRRSFIASVTMPTLQLVAGLGVISLLIWIMGIFGDMSDILGLGLRGASGVAWFWLYIGIVSAVIFAIHQAFTRNLGGIQNLIPLLYMIPIIGPSLQTITISRFAWTLSLGMEAGLDPIRSVSLALASTDSDYYRAGAKEAEQAIRQGSTLSEALQATSLFPEDFLGRVEIAEISGTGAESIGGLAREYDERAKMALKAIARLASGIVWVAMLLIILAFIIKLLMFIIEAYSLALSPI